MEFFDAFVQFSPSQELMGKLGFSGFLSLSRIRAERQGDLQKATPQTLIESQNVEVLRAACKMGRTRFLLMGSFQPDVGLLRDAAEHEKAFIIPISLLLESHGIQRAILMGRMRFFLKLCVKFRAPYILSSGARDEYGLKSPQELIAIGEALGLSHDQAEWAIAEAPRAFIAEKAENSP